MLTRGRQDSRSRECPGGDSGVSEADVLMLEIDAEGGNPSQAEAQDLARAVGRPFHDRLAAEGDVQAWLR